MSRLQREAKLKAKAQMLVDHFNTKYPVGSLCPHKKVGIFSVPFVDREVTGKAFVSMSNEPVAYFKDLSGYYSIESDFVKY
jgi:hypothetical protein